MTQLFHQLRSRSRALAHGLMLVLMATWLSAVCPHCLAQTDISGTADVAASDMATHCHGDAPAPVAPLTHTHDQCPQSPVCTGSDCAQLTAITPGEPLSVLVPELSTPAFVAADFISHAYPSTPPPSAPVARTAAFDACPLYLRHCTFLN
ncbi:MAG TPA: hypothetical protein VIR60_00785 [Gammaproteobacteria bacterium]